MSVPSFQAFSTPDRLLTKLQQNVQQVLSALVGVPIVQGALASYTVPAAGIDAGASFVVNQGLGQAVKAVFPAAYASQFSVSSTTSTTVVLTSSAALKAGLTLYFWVI